MGDGALAGEVGDPVPLAEFPGSPLVPIEVADAPGALGTTVKDREAVDKTGVTSDSIQLCPSIKNELTEAWIEDGKAVMKAGAGTLFVLSAAEMKAFLCESMASLGMAVWVDSQLSMADAAAPYLTVKDARSPSALETCMGY